MHTHAANNHHPTRRSYDSVVLSSSSSSSSSSASSYANIVYNSLNNDVTKKVSLNTNANAADGGNGKPGNKNSDSNTSQHHTNDPPHDPSGQRTNEPIDELPNPNQFIMILTEEDERICRERAEATMNTHRNLKVDIIEDLVQVYKENDDILVKHAQEYLRSLPQQIEANKQQATQDWLKGKSEKEKEQYLQRHGQTSHI